MAEITTEAAEVFRDYVSDGVPASGAHEPIKTDIRSLFQTIDARINLVGETGAYIVKSTLAALDADLDHAADVYALVVADTSSPPANGYYTKVGASGSGSWSYVGPDRIGDEAVARAAADTSLATRITVAEDFVDDVGELVVGDQLYDAATMRVEGQYVVSNGTLGADAAWAYIKIPVTPGQNYAWASNTTRRVGSCFLTSGGVGISPSTYDNTAGTGGVSQTRTAPATAAFLAINIRSNSIAEPTQMMVNLGTTALAYEAYVAPYYQLTAESSLSSRIEAAEDRISTAEDFIDTVSVLVTSDNLYDPDARQEDQYVASSTDAITTGATDWATTDWIEVEEGESYTISWVGTKRTGVLFTASYGTTTGITGSRNGSSSNPLTVTAPTGATHMVVNVQSNAIPEPTKIMINAGASALPWVPYINELQVSKGKISPALVDLDGRMTKASLVVADSTDEGSTFWTVPLGSGEFVQALSPFPPVNRWDAQCWNWYSYSLDGVTSGNGATDDIAPYRIMDTTIGANHGYQATRETVTGHGKTLADVGSVWSNSGTQWVILDIVDANTIALTKRAGNTVFAGGELAHVSGATNTASFTPSARVQQQWYPSIKNRRLRLIVDGVEVRDYDATYYPQKSVAWCESYQIMEKDSIVEWLITQAGTPTFIEEFDGTAVVDVSMAYTFDLHGGVTIATDFLALENVSAFSDIMFVHMNDMAAVGGVLKYLIPDTLPVTHETVSYDFSEVQSMVGWAPSTRLNFAPSTWIDEDVAPDRVVQINGSIGYAVGYLPIRDAAPDVRPANAAGKALQIAEGGKIYMSAIDNAKSTLTAGDYYSVVAYKVAFPLSADRTASYVVRGPDADWLYVDWHDTIIDRLDLPADLHGREYTVHRKTSGVTIRSAYATDSIVFDVTTSGGAGRYAILKFAR